MIARGLKPEFSPSATPKANGSDQSLIALDEDWVAQAELVVVRSTEGGSVERRLAIADFPIRTE